MRRKPPEQPKPSGPPEQTPPRYCPNCGAANPGNGLRCTVCGQPFASRQQVAEYWEGESGAPAGTATIVDVTPNDASSSPSPSTQETVPLGATRPVTRPADPGSSSAGTLNPQPGRAGSGTFAPPQAMMLPRRRQGPPGALLGCLGLLLIGLVAAAFVWYGARPWLGQRTADEVGVALDNEFAAIATVPVDPQGRITLTEAQINRSLRENADAYEPLSAPNVQIDTTGIAVTFDLYGLESTLTGQVAVENNRLVLVSPQLDGPAEGVIDLETVVTSAEASLAELMARNRLTPTAVETTDGQLIITTKRA